MGVVRKDPRYDEYYSLKAIPSKPVSIPSYAYHDRFEKQWRGRMMVDIEAISKIFVGTGEYELGSRGIYQPFARTNKGLVMPGTSIKGVVRTYAEALSPSCEGGSRPREGERCNPDQGRLCIACCIFGALGFQGRVTFCDTGALDPSAISPDEYAMSVRRSDREGRYDDGRRFYYHNKPSSPQLVNERTGRPFPDERVEVVPKGTFTTELLFENLSTEEMGLLLLAMGLSPDYRFDLKLGGGKNRRLGSVRFHLPSGIQVVTEDAYISFAPSYETKQMDDWGKGAVMSYLDSLTERQRRLARECIKAFQIDPS